MDRTIKRIPAVFVFILISAATQAATVTWGGSDGSWTDPTAWVPAGVPTASDDVLASSGALFFQSGSGACASLGISNTAILDVNNAGNSLSIGGNVTVSGNAAEVQVNSGSFNVGGTLNLQNNCTMYLFAGMVSLQAFNPAGGHLEWDGGTLRFTNGLYIYAGQPFSNLTVAAGRTLETVSSNLYVGDTGTLTLASGTINCDAFIKTAAATFAFNDGTMTVNGGGFDWGGNTLGIEGDTSAHQPTLVLNGFYAPISYLTFTGGVALAQDANRNAQLALSGGTHLTATGSIADGAGSSATAMLTGGSSWIASTLTVGGGGTGTLSIQGGSSVSQSTAIVVGRDSTATGTVTVSGAGSSWQGWEQAQIGVSGTAVLQITNGGAVTFNDQTTATAFALYSGSRADVTVDGNGSQFQIQPGANPQYITFGSGGQASLTVSNGGSTTWSEFTEVAAQAGGQGSITVTGTGSNWSVGDQLWLGSYGNGTLQVLSGGTVHTDSARIGSESTGAVGSATVSGTGSVWYAGGAAVIGLEFLVGRYGTGSLTVNQGGAVYSGGYSEVAQNSGSRGYVTVTDTNSLWAINGQLMVSSSQSNTVGSVTIANGGLVTVSQSASLYAGGTVTLQGGANGPGVLAADTLILSGGSIAGDGNGTLRVNAVSGQPANWTLPANLQIGSTVGSSAANWSIGSGQSLTVAGGLIIGYDKSATLSVSGSGRVEVGGTLTVGTNGLLTGNGGTIAANITSGGTIAPGNSPGTLSISGNLTLLNTSALNMELGGTNTAEFDRLLVSGSLIAGGNVSVTLFGGFLPQVGDTFKLFDYGVAAGAFAQINLPGGYHWDTSHLLASTSDPLYGSLIVSAIPEPSTTALAGMGLAALAAWCRQRRRPDGGMR